MEGQSLLFVLVFLPPPFRAPTGHEAPCWEMVVHFLPPGRHGVAEEDSPVGAWASVSDALPSAKQCENQGVDPGCDWAVGVGLRSDSGACS